MKEEEECGFGIIRKKIPMHKDDIISRSHRIIFESPDHAVIVREVPIHSIQEANEEIDTWWRKHATKKRFADREH